MTYLNLLVTQIGPISVLIILNYKNYKELKQSTTLQNQLTNVPMAEMTNQGTVGQKFKKTNPGQKKLVKHKY